MVWTHLQGSNSTSSPSSSVSRISTIRANGQLPGYSVNAARVLNFVIWGLNTTSIYLFMHHAERAVSREVLGWMERTLVIAVAFGALSYFDLRRIRPDISAGEISRHCVRVLCGEVLLIIPLGTIGIGMLFLFIDSIVEALGLPEAWLNKPIEWGCLYGPFASVYVFTKKRALEAHSLPK
eukprot:CAMPEP_0197867122 /NCGR_PEP_ID=MMETSP1438-20131217/44586_1 /TAXON_ID=1461541 /ORGANISM="Pterosperma sp., Strain CCMP1384" /LENGTH=179 /DNA_ID=CAMNT_0043485745 /DNA_START=696 /DNA_END=1235 /DNA_ORIENTATION=-